MIKLFTVIIVAFLVSFFFSTSLDMKRRLLRSPWTAVRLNQSILKEINPEYSMEELMLMLKLQSFGHLMPTVDSGKDPDSGKGYGQEEKGVT